MEENETNKFVQIAFHPVSILQIDVHDIFIVVYLTVFSKFTFIGHDPGKDAAKTDPRLWALTPDVVIRYQGILCINPLLMFRIDQAYARDAGSPLSLEPLTHERWPASMKGLRLGNFATQKAAMVALVS